MIVVSLASVILALLNSEAIRFKILDLEAILVPAQCFVLQHESTALRYSNPTEHHQRRLVEALSCHRYLFPGGITMFEGERDSDSKRIRPARFDENRWREHGGLVANRKPKAEAGIVAGRIRYRTTAVHAVHLPPENNIAALDFGTTYCSLAIITDGSDTASCLKLDGYCPRVPNAILFRKLVDSSSATDVPCEIRAFGKKAQETHSKLKPNEVSQHLFFERIKMNLQHDPVSTDFM